MAHELGFSYAEITKSEKHDDGTISVYGKATDDTLDVDLQICDPAWLSKAMPDWFVEGGNIREQHSSIAAGVATDYVEKSDGHYITAHVVDPTSVKKVEAGVLKGFSIGIRSPRVIRDSKAPGGRIVDGKIVEISLVDRPANPAAKLMLAKAIEGELIAVEQVDVLKYSDDQPRDENGRFGSGGGDSNSTGGSGSGSSSNGYDEKTNVTAIQGHLSDIGAIADEMGGLKDSLTPEANARIEQAQIAVQNAQASAKEGDMYAASEHINEAVGHINSNDVTFAHSEAASNLQDRVNEIDRSLGKEFLDWQTQGTGRIQRSVESKKESGTMNIPTPADVFKNAEPEIVEETPEVEVPAVEETVEATPEEELAEAAKSFVATLNKFDQATFDRARTALADLIIVEATEMAQFGSNEKDSIEELLDAVKHLFRWYEGEVEAGEVADPIITDEVSEDDDIIELSAKSCDKCDEKMCKCGDKSAHTEVVAIDDAQVSDIVEKAVKTAKDAVMSEVELLKSALEAEKAKSAELTADLDNALSKAVAGGPARTATTPKPFTSPDALLNKASDYRLKASTTTDRTLAKGYEELAEELERKAKKA